MGQPILVGHHSERKHRGALERHDRKMRKSVDASRKAESARYRAAGAGQSISSDDPDAIEALTEKLEGLEATRALHKAINAAWRRGGAEAVAQLDGVSERTAKAIEASMSGTWAPKRPMELTNLGANIRRIKQRIADLEAAAEREAAPPIEGEGFTIEEVVDDNRIRFRFDVRPDRDVVAKMKRAGFRWSPTNSAWQRHLNAAGRSAARRMANELFGWVEPKPMVRVVRVHKLSEKHVNDWSGPHYEYELRLDLSCGHRVEKHSVLVVVGDSFRCVHGCGVAEAS